MRSRTEPLYTQAAADALSAAFDAPGTAVSLWGKLALRQQQLQLPTETAKATLICEARRLAAERLAAATELQQQGNEAAALAEVAKIVTCVLARPMNAHETDGMRDQWRP